jgi:hypothetical protein
LPSPVILAQPESPHLPLFLLVLRVILSEIEARRSCALKLFFAKNLSKIACQPLNPPNSFIPLRIKLSLLLTPICYSLSSERKKGKLPHHRSFPFCFDEFSATPMD